MYLKFSSWTELFDLINKNNNDDKYNKTDRNNYLQIGRKIMQQHWNEIDIEWKRFFKLNLN